MMRHLLINQIIPRYLASQGSLIIHAGAASLENGSSVAFMGRSGSGKSTLASGFHQSGAELISDDCILLQPLEHEVKVIGGLSGIRLLPDSKNALFSESSGFTRYSPFSEKQQLLLSSNAALDKPQPYSLDALYILDHSRDFETINIQQLPPSIAIMALIQCAFSLDPSDHETTGRNFHSIGLAMCENLDVFNLTYPRKHELLSNVVEAISTHVANLP